MTNIVKKKKKSNLHPFLPSHNKMSVVPWFQYLMTHGML